MGGWTRVTHRSAVVVDPPAQCILRMDRVRGVTFTHLLVNRCVTRHRLTLLLDALRQMHLSEVNSQPFPQSTHPGFSCVSSLIPRVPQRGRAVVGLSSDVSLPAGSSNTVAGPQCWSNALADTRAEYISLYGSEHDAFAGAKCFTFACSERRSIRSAFADSAGRTAMHGQCSASVSRVAREGRPYACPSDASVDGELRQGMPGDVDEGAADALIYRNYATKVQARYDQHRDMYRMLMTTDEDAGVPHT